MELSVWDMFKMITKISLEEMRNTVLWTDVSVCHGHKVNVEMVRATNVSLPCSSIISVLYELMYKQPQIFLPTSLPFQFLARSFLFLHNLQFLAKPSCSESSYGSLCFNI